MHAYPESPSLGVPVPLAPHGPRHVSLRHATCAWTKLRVVVRFRARKRKRIRKPGGAQRLTRPSLHLTSRSTPTLPATDWPAPYPPILPPPPTAWSGAAHVRAAAPVATVIVHGWDVPASQGRRDGVGAAHRVAALPRRAVPCASTTTSDALHRRRARRFLRDRWRRPARELHPARARRRRRPRPDGAEEQVVRGALVAL